MLDKILGSSVLAPIAPYFKLIKWGLIISCLLISHSCAYYKGREAVIEKSASKQLKQLEKDNVQNVERAERVTTAKAEKDVRVEKKLQELNDAIEAAKNIRTSDCRISDDELRLLNELFDEANRGVSQDRP